MINPLNHPDSLEACDEIRSRLLVMFMDAGIRFTVVYGSRTSLKKSFSISHDHFVPWIQKDIRTVQNRELSAQLEEGCRRLVPSVTEVTLSLSTKSHLGVKSDLDLDQIAICLPAAWSCRKSSALEVSERPSRKKLQRITGHFVQDLNAQTLLAMKAGDDLNVLIDGTATYWVDDEECQHAAPIDQEFRRFGYQAEFIAANRHKCRTILNCLKRIWVDPRIVWISEHCLLSRLLSDTDIALVDAGQLSARVHRHMNGVHSMVRESDYGIARFQQQLSSQLGVLNFSVEDFDRLNRVRLFERSIAGGVAAPLDLEYEATGSYSRSSIERAMQTLAKTYWNKLLEKTGEVAGSRMVVAGDSPTYLLSLAKAAAAHGRNVEIEWPDVRVKQGLEPSARAVLRAVDLFHRQPFHGFCVGNLKMHQTEKFIKKAARQTGRATVCMLHVAVATIIEKMMNRT
ncbi:MAG: hypothetical protein K9M45_04210 [Kiritimatiellales bacterium]|nr:hypothetical protein [Kiritimatiellales bacterium]